MDNLIYILFICIALPLILSLAILDKKARLIVGYIVIGAFMCVFVSEINGYIRSITDESMFYITTTFTPITEEIVKALPVLFFAFVISDKRETLISIAMAVGIGFAILENAYIMASNIDSVDILWSIERVFGAGLMHGICTSCIGIGASFVRKKKKLFYTGTFALLSTAIVYHAIYNALVQSDIEIVGYLMPFATYIPIYILAKKIKKKAPVKNQST